MKMYPCKRSIAPLVLLLAAVSATLGPQDAQAIDCNLLPPLSGPQEESLVDLLKEADYNWEVDKLLREEAVSNLRVSQYVCTVARRASSWRALLTKDVARMFDHMEECLLPKVDESFLAKAKLTLHPSTEYLLTSGKVARHMLKRCVVDRAQADQPSLSIVYTCRTLMRDFDEYQTIKKVEHIYKNTSLLVSLSEMDENLLKLIGVVYACENYLW